MRDSTFANFKHIVVGTEAPKTLFLLHGTGGDEADLLPLVEKLKTQYTLVGLKGNVSQQGLTRFFERSETGVFNQGNIRIEAKKLADFLRAWSATHEVAFSSMAFLGYSNGANMILALLFLYPELVFQAVLLHPMLPFTPQKIDLKGKKLLVSYGMHDQLISLTESQKVISFLETTGAQVEVSSHFGGHEIQASELSKLQDFLS